MSDKEQEKILEELQEMAKKTGLDFSEEIEKITKKLQSSKDAAAKVWKHVELARHSDRPRALDYINLSTVSSFAVKEDSSTVIPQEKINKGRSSSKIFFTAEIIKFLPLFNLRLSNTI